MLMIIRGTAVLIRRVFYISIALCLFMASAAIGAAYRDAHPGENWKENLMATVQASIQNFSSATSQVSQSFFGLVSDLRIFAKDIRGNNDPSATRKSAPKVPPVEPGDGSIVVSVSAPGDLGPDAESAAEAIAEGDQATENVATLHQLGMGPQKVETVADPLKWLSESSDCSAVERGLVDRYGSSEFADELDAKSRREEYRHVFQEVCGSPRFSECHFDFCRAGGPVVAKAEVPVTEETSDVLLEEEEVTASEPIEKTISQQRAQMKNSVTIRDVAKAVRPAPIAPAREILAKKVKTVPADDSLAAEEVPHPALGKRNFPAEVSDEPDEYRMILRRGQSARESLGRSEGR